MSCLLFFSVLHNQSLIHVTFNYHSVLSVQLHIIAVTHSVKRMPEHSMNLIYMLYQENASKLSVMN